MSRKSADIMSGQDFTAEQLASWPVGLLVRRVLQFQVWRAATNRHDAAIGGAVEALEAENRALRSALEKANERLRRKHSAPPARRAA